MAQEKYIFENNLVNEIKGDDKNKKEISESEILLSTPHSFKLTPSALGSNHRKELIENGKKRMEAFRNRPNAMKESSSKNLSTSTHMQTSQELINEDLEILKTQPKENFHLSINENSFHCDSPIGFNYSPTENRTNFNRQLEKLKKDELDLAAAEWSEQRRSVALMRNEYLTRINKLEAEKKSLQELAASQSKILQEEEKRSKYLQDQVQSLSSEIKLRASRSVISLSEINIDNENDLIATKNKLETQTKIIENLREANEILENKFIDMKAIEKNNIYLNDQINQLHEELTTKNNSLIELEKKVHKASSDHDQLQNENSDLTEKLLICTNQVQYLKNRLQLVEDQTDVTQQTETNLRETELKLKKKLLTTEEELEESHIQLSSLEDKFQSLRIDFEHSNETNHNLSTANRKLQSEIEQNNELVAVLKDQLQKKSNSLEEADSRVADCSLTIEELTNKIEKLESNLVSIKDYCHECERKIEIEETNYVKLKNLFQETEENHKSAMRKQRHEFKYLLEKEKKNTASMLKTATMDLDEQKDHFMKTTLQAQFEKNHSSTRDAFSLIIRELRSMRNILEKDDSKLNNFNQSLSSKSINGNHSSNTIRALQQRLKNLENIESRHNINKVKDDTTCDKQTISEQKRIIHQLTLEVEQSRKSLDILYSRLENEGLCQSTKQTSQLPRENSDSNAQMVYNDLSKNASMENSNYIDDKNIYGIEFLQKQLEKAQEVIKNETEARHDAERRVAFLQSDFTKTFMQFFEQAKKKKIKEMKEQQKKKDPKTGINSKSTVAVRTLKSTNLRKK